jgi:uncharacterized membrane protein YraQ (UPF0718 family)
MSFFGPKVALAYVVVGLVLAVIGGALIDKAGMEKYVESYVKEIESTDVTQEEMTVAQRVEFGVEQVKDIVNRVWKYVLIGVGIGALIHNWIPQSVVETALGSNNPVSVFIATVIGVPMYADIFGTLPIAEALFLKGVGIGTVLSFMMAVTALSLPSLIMLSKVVKRKLLIFFTVMVTIGIVIIGYGFNAFAFLLI